MSLRADFTTIYVREHLGDNKNDISNDLGFEFVGDQSTVFNFTIEQEPIGRGYFIISAYDVQHKWHRFEINGNPFRSAGLFPEGKANKWVTNFAIIPENILRQGNNTFQVIRESGGDNFLVEDIVINWHEEVNTSRFSLFGFITKIFNGK